MEIGFDFDLLVEEIKDGSVVPIIGSELYVDASGAPLEPALATRFRAELRLPPAAPEDGSQTVRDVALAHRGPAALLVPAFRRACEALLRETPAPLRQLAEIRDFPLYVTTTPDGLLESALTAGGRSVRSVGYTLGKPTMDVPDLRTTPLATVCHVFGRLNETCAMTDAEVLEYLAALLSETRRPQRLFDELGTRHLLFIGCGFPDWLSRLFIRVMKAEPFARGDKRLKFMADAQAADDTRLSLFLRGYELLLYPPGPAVEFVNELHHHWSERTHMPPPAAPSDDTPTFKESSVFLSFSSADRASVRAIRDELDRAGIDVWFDERDITPGDDWNRIINQNLLRASLFVPFVSRNTEAFAETPKDFWHEWTLADERSRYFAPGTRFILPIALDPIDPQTARVPDSFKAAQWFELHERLPTDKLVSFILKEFRIKQAGRA